ncbi:MAG: hypothetical protein EBR45_08790, partial [Betaproteobacteria bacterium]|nr:hypothetical protein [Betaproteobacteria bacterium]
MVRALMCVLLLSACSPKYDWREAGDPALGMRVLFPGKPDVAVRTILLGNLTLEMRQQGVRVDQTMFIAGGATLPAADDGVGKKSWFSITGFVAHDEPGAPLPDLSLFETLFDRSLPTTEGEAWNAVADWLRGAVDRFATGKATAGDVPIL